VKSIKPGRGPSAMGGVMSIASGLFGLVWTFIALQMGAVIMVPFGLIFIGISVVQAVYHFKNATSKNRYSAFDITDTDEEPDPLNERFGSSEPQAPNEPGQVNFCPYCGAKADEDHVFCSKCGKKLS